jgi:hypothetical protein
MAFDRLPAERKRAAPMSRPASTTSNLALRVRAIIHEPTPRIVAIACDIRVT